MSSDRIWYGLQFANTSNIPVEMKRQANICTPSLKNKKKHLHASYRQERSESTHAADRRASIEGMSINLKGDNVTSPIRSNVTTNLRISNHLSIAVSDVKSNINEGQRSL